VTRGVRRARQGRPGTCGGRRGFTIGAVGGL